MLWKKVTLVGVGLLGGSLGLALKKGRLAQCITGFVRRPASIAERQQAGAVDVATLDLNAATHEADLIVLCTPLAQMRPLVEQMSQLKKGAIVTDVGSVKASVVRELESLVARRGAHFIGSHPMAGAEKMGVLAARADLFNQAVCVLTPTAKSRRPSVRQLEGLWRAVGARVLTLSPEVHDELVSRSSHLPHVVAAGLAELILDPRSRGEQALLCANGFRDTTRIASGSPEMWRDIAIANRTHLARSVRRFIGQLAKLERKIAAGDAAAIERFFSSAKERRDRWVRPSTTASPE